MNKSGIYIIGCSDTDEKVCAASGRISTQKGSALEIMKKSMDRDKNANLISKVTASGHTSTVEHIFFNLAFENVSVVVEQFMIEFRLASFTVKSRRYVDFSDSGYFVPSTLDNEIKDKYIKNMDRLFSLYAKLTDAGIPKEDARFVLPYCFYSNFYCSLNGRELVRVLQSMLFGRGRKIKEIYDLGLGLLKECKKYAPGIFSGFEAQYGKFNDEIDLSFINSENKKDITKNVEILSYTDNAVQTVAKSVLVEKLGMDSYEADIICKDKESCEKIIASLFASSRPRALETVSFTVRYNNVTLSTLTHFARHRMQTLLIPSLDSCDREKYVIAPSISENSELLNEYTDAFYRTKQLYDEMISRGYGESETVYCLLSGNTLSIISTMNARELKLFLKLRTCSRAQWEIRDLTVELLKQLRLISPEIFKFYGPSCYCEGFCPEGRLTCGKAKEYKDYFAKL